MLSIGVSRYYLFLLPTVVLYGAKIYSQETDDDWCAKVYENTWYNGLRVTLPETNHGSLFETDYDNEVSAVRIRPGCTLKGFDDNNQQDLIFTYIKDESNLFMKHGQNDRMTSYTCSCQAPGDNLLIIGGSTWYDYDEDYVTNVTLVSMERDHDKCSPSDLPFGVSYHSSVSTDNGIITCGGDLIDSDDFYSSRCIIQNRKGYARSVPSMVRKRGSFGLAVLDTTLYAIGGTGIGSANTMETIKTSNIHENHWTEEKLPFNLTTSCTVTVKHYIVLVGGNDEEHVLATTRIYDTLKNKWTQGPSLKEKRVQHTCFYDEHENTIYVVGGRDHWKSYGRYLNTTEKWNFDRNEWESFSVFPVAVAMSAAVASKSIDFIGFVTGGWVDIPRIMEDDYYYNEDDWKPWHYENQKKVWGLRRTDLLWISMPQSLSLGRYGHSMVNVAAWDIPGCY